MASVTGVLAAGIAAVETQAGAELTFRELAEAYSAVSFNGDDLRLGVSTAHRGECAYVEAWGCEAVNLLGGANSRLICGGRG